MSYLGYNVNDYYSNGSIPRGYLLNPATPSGLTGQVRSDIKLQTNPTRVRTLIWLAEADPVETPWLHIPLTDAEVSRIQDYTYGWTPTKVELSWGPLWEALWLKEEQGVAIPDHPAHTPQELFEMYQSSLWRLLYTGIGIANNTRIDLYNEFDLLLGDKAQATMALWYPWARDAVKQARLESTVSVILPPDGNPQRAIDTYQWIANLGAGLPDVMEVHCNGWTNEGLYEDFPETLILLEDKFNLPFVVGECDVELNDCGLDGIACTSAKELTLWR